MMHYDASLHIRGDKNDATCEATCPRHTRRRRRRPHTAMRMPHDTRPHICFCHRTPTHERFRLPYGGLSLITCTCVLYADFVIFCVCLCLAKKSYFIMCIYIIFCSSAVAARLRPGRPAAPRGPDVVACGVRAPHPPRIPLSARSHTPQQRPCQRPAGKACTEESAERGQLSCLHQCKRAQRKRSKSGCALDHGQKKGLN